MVTDNDRENVSQYNKAMKSKLRASILVNDEKLKALSLKSGTRQGSTLLFLYSKVLGVSGMQQE